MRGCSDINAIEIKYLYSVSPLDTVLSEQVKLEKYELDVPRVFFRNRTAVVLSYTSKLKVVFGGIGQTCCFLRRVMLAKLFLDPK